MNHIFTTLAWWLDKEFPQRLKGWATLEKAEAMAMAAFTLRPEIAVEIGVFGGRSLLPVALVMREVGKGTIHAIDPWSGECSAEGYPDKHAEWWKNADHETIRKSFLKLLSACNLENYVKIHREKSDDVSPPETIDLLHIDGQHTAQARKDVSRFAAKVRVGGLVFMDDISWDNEGQPDVKEAVKDLVRLGFKKLFGLKEENNDWECYQRIKKII